MKSVPKPVRYCLHKPSRVGTESGDCIVCATRQGTCNEDSARAILRVEYRSNLPDELPRVPRKRCPVGDFPESSPNYLGRFLVKDLEKITTDK